MRWGCFLGLERSSCGEEGEEENRQPRKIQKGTKKDPTLLLSLCRDSSSCMTLMCFSIWSEPTALAGVGKFMAVETNRVRRWMTSLAEASTCCCVGEFVLDSWRQASSKVAAAAEAALEATTSRVTLSQDKRIRKEKKKKKKRKEGAHSSPPAATAFVRDPNSVMEAEKPLATFESFSLSWGEMSPENEVPMIDTSL